MESIVERARELATKYMGANCMEHCWCQYRDNNADDYVSCEDNLVGLIEQALLVERRLALTEASKMLVFLEREDASFEGTDDEFWSYAASEGVAQYRKHIKGLIDSPRGGDLAPVIQWQKF